MFGRYPSLKKLFADGRYQGPIFTKGQKKARPYYRDHQAIRYGQRLRAAATPLGGRANLRMARAMPQAGQGPREPVEKRARIPQIGINSPPYVAKAALKLISFRTDSKRYHSSKWRPMREKYVDILSKE